MKFERFTCPRGQFPICATSTFSWLPTPFARVYIEFTLLPPTRSNIHILGFG